MKKELYLEIKDHLHINPNDHNLDKIILKSYHTVMDTYRKIPGYNPSRRKNIDKRSIQSQLSALIANEVMISFLDR
jgi:hypothetical protein